MSDAKISDIIRTSLEGIRDFTDVDTTIGRPIVTDCGVTLIPISKISIGFATGGVDFAGKRIVGNQTFGGGGGSGISITPIAFLTVNKNADINLIPVNPGAVSGVEGAISFIERTPELIKRIKDALT